MAEFRVAIVLVSRFPQSAAQLSSDRKRRAASRRIGALLIILYICAQSVSHADCNDKTARAVIRQHVESVMCGVPSQYTTLLTGETGPKEGEYVRVRCQMR